MGLPAQLQRIDDWIDDGLLGGEMPNAADLQIGSTIRLLVSIGDVRPLIEGRAAAGLSRYFPPLRGEVPPGALPAEWMPGARRGLGEHARRDAGRLAPALRRPAAPAADPPRRRPRSRRARRGRRPGARRPGSLSPRSSSRAGISTKRRASSCSCGSVISSWRSSSSPSSRMSMSIVRGPWRRSSPPRPSRRSSSLTAPSSSSGSSVGADPQAGVEEAALVEHLAHRVGVVGGGARQHLHAGAG